MSQRTAVYWLYDSAGAVLYIGMSWRPDDRFRVYASERAWWPDVDQTKTMIEWFDSRPEARKAEVAAIGLEHPRHNVAETPLHARVSGHRHSLTSQELEHWASTDTFSGRRAGRTE